MQLQPMLGQPFLGAGHDAVEEHDRRVPAFGPRGADRVDEFQLRSAVRRQVLDQQHAVALAHLALDLGGAAVALGLLADIGHRQAHPLGHEGGKGDACGLAARDVVEGLQPRGLHHGAAQEIHQRGAHARVGDDLAAVDIGGRLLAGGMGVELIGVEMHRPDVEQHPGRKAGHGGAVRVGGGDHGWRPDLRIWGKMKAQAMTCQ